MPRVQTAGCPHSQQILDPRKQSCRNTSDNAGEPQSRACRGAIADTAIERLKLLQRIPDSCSPPETESRSIALPRRERWSHPFEGAG